MKLYYTGDILFGTKMFHTEVPVLKDKVYVCNGESFDATEEDVRDLEERGIVLGLGAGPVCVEYMITNITAGK